MATLEKLIRSWLRRKGVHWDELEQEEKPMQKMREKQGEGFWQADIGLESSEEEEKRKKKKP